MGIKPDWREDFSECIGSLDIEPYAIDSSKYSLLGFGNKELVVNLVSLNSNDEPADLIALQNEYSKKNSHLVQLWEDVWQSRRDQVIGRIESILGMNKRLHGRKTNIVTITQKQADEFLNEHHLQGTARSKYKFALAMHDKIVAVACFSGLRTMKEISADYKSAEIVRFATLTGYTVTGGFSKLLKYFIDRFKPDDVMSYADRDWSLGKVYERSGFKLKEITPPSKIWLNRDTLIRYFPHRIPGDPALSSPDCSENEYVKIFNTGNLKYILYL